MSAEPKYTYRPNIEAHADGSGVELIIYLGDDKRLRIPLVGGIVEKFTGNYDQHGYGVYQEDNLSTIEIQAKERKLV